MKENTWFRFCCYRYLCVIF